MNRRVPGSVWILLVLGVGVLSGAALFFTKSSAEESRVDAERRTVQGRIATLRGDRVLRPLFFEPEEAGNSWDLVTRALQGLEKLSPSEREAFPRLSHEEEPKIKPEEAEKALATLAPHIDELKGALRRRWTEPAYAYEQHYNLQMPSLAKSIQMSRILSDASAFRFSQGRTVEAVDFLLMTWGLADRLHVKGTLVNGLVSIVVRSIGFETLQKQLAAHRFTAEDLDRLQRGLDRMTTLRSDMIDCFRVEDLMGRILAVEYSVLGGEAFRDARQKANWTDFAATRASAATYLEIQDRLVARFDEALRLPYSERQQALAVAFSGAASERSPLHALTVPQMARAWRNHSVNCENASLARMAVATARCREARGAWPESLSDLVPQFLSELPKGAFADRPFTFSVRDDAATIYSWGEDGDDDGGRAFDDAVGGDPEDSDLVWVVKRAP